MSKKEEIEKYRDYVLKEVFGKLGKDYESEKPISYMPVRVLNIEKDCPIWISIDFPRYDNQLNNAVVDCIIKKFDNTPFSEINNLKNIDAIYSEAEAALHEYINTILFKSERLLINLSKHKYEKKECIGTFLFCSKLHETEKLELFRFENEIDFEENNIKLLRKIIEMTSSNIGLYVEGTETGPKVFGLVKMDSAAFGIEVKIEGINEFKIVDKSGKMSCKEINQQVFFEHYNTFFTVDCKDKINCYFKKIGVDENKIQYLYKYFEDLMYNNPNYNGTIIIFTDDREFTKRMYVHDRAIKNKTKLNLFSAYSEENKLSKKILMNICNIDGAVVFNNRGDLNLFGAILDGKAITKGDSSKGARYNSTKSFKDYYSTKRMSKNYLAISMSVDKGNISVF